MTAIHPTAQAVGFLACRKVIHRRITGDAGAPQRTEEWREDGIPEEQVADQGSTHCQCEARTADGHGVGVPCVRPGTIIVRASGDDS